MKEYVVKIKDIEIPYYIKNYKSAKSIKLYFKEDRLVITKSPYVAKKEAEKLILNNIDEIYNTYKAILGQNQNRKPNWCDGQEILYKGEKFRIKTIYIERLQININIDKEERIINISIPTKYKDSEELYVKKAIIQLYKKKTEEILDIKLPYWSEKTNIRYNVVTIRDARTKYGSCIPKTKALHFTSRLIMLKEEAIDAVVVHELCHIIHPNHSKEFYDLVQSFIPNYKQIDKYLKDCSKFIRI